MSRISLRVLDSSGEQHEIPDRTSLQPGFEFCDIGSLSLDYDPDGVNADLLTDGAEIIMLVDGVEIDDGRWIIRGTSGDDADELTTKSFSGRSISVKLEKTVCWPSNGDWNAPLPWVFNNATPGDILDALFTHAQSHGAMQGFTWSFTGALDTDGQAWAQILSITYKVGVKYIDVLRNLVDQGMIDFRLHGREIQVYNADTMGVDRTLLDPPVILRNGRDYTEAPYKTSSEEIASHVIVGGDEDIFVLMTDAGTEATWGHEEIFVSQGGTKDLGTLSLIGQNTINHGKTLRQQLTRGLDLEESEHYPLADYAVGDYIFDNVSGTNERLRIRALTLDIDQDDVVTGSITLNDKFLEAEIRMARRVNGILGGANNDGSGNGLPADTPVTDNTTPKAPTGLAFFNDAYISSSGFSRALIGASWTPPTHNTDNSILTDFDTHELRWKYNDPKITSSDWHYLSTAEASLAFSDLEPGVNVDVEVRANDTNGHKSAWLSGSTTTATDATAPPQPSVPIVSAYLGQIIVTWDGKDYLGGAMPPDLRNIEVHASIVSDFTPDNSTYKAAIRDLQGGISILSGWSYGVEVFVKLVAVDTSDNASDASAQASATPERVSGLDLESGAISYATLGFKDDGNLVLDGSFERADAADWIKAHSSTIDPALDTIAVIADGNTFHGLQALRVVSSGPTTTTSYLNLTAPPNEPTSNPTIAAIPVKPDQSYFVRCAYTFAPSTVGTVRLNVRYGGPDGTFVDEQYITLNNANEVWTEASSGGFVVPAGTAWMTVRITVSSGFDGGFRVDAVEVRQKIATALIENAAITNALIANGAIDDLKVANMSGGKILSRTIQTDALALGSVGPKESAFGIGGNLIPNPNWADADIRAQYPMTDPFEYNATSSTWITGGMGVIMRSEECGANNTRPIGPDIMVQPGERYWMHVQMKRYQTTVPASFNLRVMDKDKGIAAWDLRPATAPGTAANLTWVTYEGVVTIPDNAAWVRPEMKWHGSGPDVTGWWAFADFELRPILSTAQTGGPGTEISPRGVRMYDDDGEQAISMVTGEDNFMVFRSNGVAVASISDSGTVSGTELSGDEIYYGGRVLSDILDDLSRGVVAQGFVNNMNVSGITSNVGLYELSFTAYPDRYYDMQFGPFYVKSTVAGDLANVNIRATVDGTSPTTSNGSQYHSAIYEIASTSSPGFAVYIRVSGTFNVPAGGGTVRLLLCLSRYAGTGTLTASSAATYPLRYEVYDMGRDVPDTAVRNTGGGGTTVKKQYTKEYACAWSRRYGNAGSTTGEMYQGYYSSTWGTQRSAMGFSSWGTDLSGATVNKVEVYLYANHWYYNSGGTARIGVHQSASDPGSSPASLASPGGYISSTNWPKPGGRWVTLPSSWYAAFATNTWKGITLGWDLGSSTDRIYYSKWNGNGMSSEPKVRITYTK